MLQLLPRLLPFDLHFRFQLVVLFELYSLRDPFFVVNELLKLLLEYEVAKLVLIHKVAEIVYFDEQTSCNSTFTNYGFAPKFLIIHNLLNSKHFVLAYYVKWDQVGTLAILI